MGDPLTKLYNGYAIGRTVGYPTLGEAGHDIDNPASFLIQHLFTDGAAEVQSGIDLKKRLEEMKL